MLFHSSTVPASVRDLESGARELEISSMPSLMVIFNGAASKKLVPLFVIETTKPLAAGRTVTFRASKLEVLLVLNMFEVSVVCPESGISAIGCQVRFVGLRKRSSSLTVLPAPNPPQRLEPPCAPKSVAAPQLAVFKRSGNQTGVLLRLS